MCAVPRADVERPLDRRRGVSAASQYAVGEKLPTHPSGSSSPREKQSKASRSPSAGTMRARGTMRAPSSVASPMRRSASTPSVPRASRASDASTGRSRRKSRSTVAIRECGSLRSKTTASARSTDGPSSPSRSSIASLSYPAARNASPRVAAASRSAFGSHMRAQRTARARPRTSGALFYVFQSYSDLINGKGKTP